MTDVAPKPWQHLSSLLASERANEAKAFLADLPGLEVARTLSRLSDDDRARLLTVLGAEESAGLLDDLSDAQAVEIIEDLPPSHAAAILEELPGAERADLLADLEQDSAAAILEHLPARTARVTRQLLRYDEHTAGGLMITEFVAVPAGMTVGEVVGLLRSRVEEYTDYEIQYVFAVDDDQRLVGVVRLRDLLLARSAQPVASVLVPQPFSVSAHAPLEELRQAFADHPFLGVPVIDDAACLVGVVRRSAVEEAVGEQATEAFLNMSGLIGADELRTMPILHRSRRRLAWLSINIVLNVIAASVIALYQETLSAVIALAVFLPIISDMSGCSGNQAVAVSIRELALGLVRPYEFMRVVLKEGVVGIINGAVLGLLLGTLATLWQGNVYLGLIVGTALMLNTLLAVLLGGIIPLALKALKQDPALASGPILTTVTDMMGFLLVLSFAAASLSKLV